MTPARSLLLFLSMLPTAAVLAQPPVREPHKQFPTAPPPPYVTPDTPQGTGRYPALMEADPGLVTHTVYRPANLAALGGEKLPIVAFANGGCVNVGNRFRYFLTEIASHGFLAIAIGPMAAKEAESAVTSSVVRNPPAPGSPAALAKVQGGEGSGRLSETTARQLLDAVDWAIAENTRTGGNYQGRIDTSKIAVMGQSCGGLQAIDAAHDPRITTLGVWNSGTFPGEGRGLAMAAAPKADKAYLKSLRVPTLYITGEPADVAFPNAEDDVDRIGAPVFRAWKEQTGHLGTYREPNGGVYGQIAASWLRWQLKGDGAASRQFLGPDCGVCTQPGWHVRRKGLEQAKR